MLILMLLILIVFLVGAAIAVLSSRGVPELSEPRCAKCGYDLRGFAQTPPTRCSECGTDLTVPKAVRWGEFRRRPKLLWISAGLLVMPLFLIGALFFARSSRSPSSTFRSNAAVLTSLTSRISQPWDWRDLDTRLGAGQLSNAETAKAIDLLIADLARSAGVNQGPLTWSEGFVTRADASGAITDEQYLRLARAYYGPGKIDVSPRVRQGARLPFRLKYGGHWQLPNVKLVKAVRQVTLADGRELHAAGEEEARRSKQGAAAGPNPDYLSAVNPWDISGELTIDMPPGDYVLTFVMDAAALLPQTEPQIVQSKPGQAKHWPVGRAKWTEEISVPVTVIAADTSPVALVNDPTLDPRSTGAIKVTAVRVTRSGAGQRVSAELSIDPKAVPCSFDVVLRLLGAEYSLGHHIAHAGGSSSSEHAHTFQSLPSDVRQADLIFRPNPKQAEGVPGVDRIWGGVVVLSNVRLQRYDLEAQAATQPTAAP